MTRPRGRPATLDESDQTSLRLGADIKRRADALIDYVQGIDDSGRTVRRSDVLRRALARGIAELERDASMHASKKRRA